MAASKPERIVGATSSVHRPRQRTGRRPGVSNTRQEILSAARKSFASHGYDGTSMRGIAAAAGVDPALVRRYFTDKEGLLVASLTEAMSPQSRLVSFLDGPTDTLGERLVEYFLNVWEVAPGRELLIAAIRSACTNEAAATILRDWLSEQVLSRIGDATGRGAAKTRAAAIASQLVGLAMVRYIIKIDPLPGASKEELTAIFAPTLQRYISVPLHPADTRRT